MASEVKPCTKQFSKAFYSLINANGTEFAKFVRLAIAILIIEVQRGKELTNLPLRF